MQKDWNGEKKGLFEKNKYPIFLNSNMIFLSFWFKITNYVTAYHQTFNKIYTTNFILILTMEIPFAVKNWLILP